MIGSNVKLIPLRRMGSISKKVMVKRVSVPHVTHRTEVHVVADGAFPAPSSYASMTDEAEETDPIACKNIRVIYINHSHVFHVVVILELLAKYPVILSWGHNVVFSIACNRAFTVGYIYVILRSFI